MSGKTGVTLDFLMNYGWAILMVLAGIGALAYYGVLPGEYDEPFKEYIFKAEFDPEKHECLEGSWVSENQSCPVWNCTEWEDKPEVMSLDDYWSGTMDKADCRQMLIEQRDGCCVCCIGVSLLELQRRCE